MLYLGLGFKGLPYLEQGVERSVGVCMGGSPEWPCECLLFVGGCVSGDIGALGGLQMFSLSDAGSADENGSISTA